MTYSSVEIVWNNSKLSLEDSCISCLSLKHESMQCQNARITSAFFELLKRKCTAICKEEFRLTCQRLLSLSNMLYDGKKQSTPCGTVWKTTKTKRHVKFNWMAKNWGLNQDLSNTNGIKQSQNTDHYLANIKYHLANFILKREGL